MRALLKYLFPSPCASCGRFGEALCFECWARLDFDPHIRVIEGLKVYSAGYFVLESLVSRLIHSFKYQYQADHYRLFLPLLRDTLRLLCVDFSEVILCPVPLHKNRRLERGYNQAELFCRALSKDLGLQYSPLLVRHRETESQAKTQSKTERVKNMDGAFICQHPPPKNSHIVLVDDIVTTGSTLLACRKVLSEAGASRVSALTFADRDQIPKNPWN